MHEELTRMITSLVNPLLSTKPLQSVLMYETLSLHKDNAYSKSNGVVIVSKHHNNILCQGPEMLAFEGMQRMHFFESSPFSPKSYFAKYPKTNISNTVPKFVSNIFEINLKIN